MRAVLIFIFGAVCLGGFYYGFQQNQRLLEKFAPGDKGLLGPDPGAVGGLVIQRRGEKTIRLERRGDRWVILAPEKGPADGDFVRGLLTTLDSAEPRKRIEGPDPGGLGLERPLVELTLLDRGEGGEIRTVRVGRADSSLTGRYVRVEGRTEALLLAQAALAPVLSGVFAFRDKAILRPDPRNLTGISVESPQGAYRLIRQAEGQWRVADPETEDGLGGPVETALVAGLLEAVGSAGIREFVPATPPDQATLTLRLDGSAIKDWLRLWPPREGDNLILGRSSHQPQPFLTGAGLFRLLERPEGIFSGPLGGLDLDK